MEKKNFKINIRIYIKKIYIKKIFTDLKNGVIIFVVKIVFVVNLEK